MPTIRSLTLWLALVPVGAMVGCDNDDDTDEARSGELSSDEAAHGHRGPPIDKLCSAISCSDSQREQLGTLLAGNAPTRPSEEVFTAANAALADAWRSADFDADDLAGWRESVHDDDKASRFSASTIVAAHGLLDAKQRGIVADMLEKKGARALFGGHGGKGKHGKGKRGDKGDKAGKGDRDKKSPEAFAEHMTDKLCASLSCTDEQRNQITGALAASGPRRDRDNPANAAFAAAFRADTLAAETVQTFLDTMSAEHDAEMVARDRAMVTIHGVLTAEQRSTMATQIAEHGPRAFMPHRGGRKHGKHGKHGGGEHEVESVPV